MDVTPYIPVIIEATKFVFGELGKWLDHARQRAGETSTKSTGDASNEGSPNLARQDFATLEMSPHDLASAINANIAETNTYVIRSLVEQLQVHQKNIVDLEAVEAEYGALTPQHIRRGIEHEANAIVEKSERLKDLLSLVYGRRVENTNTSSLDSVSMMRSGK